MTTITQRYDADADLLSLHDHPRNPRRGDDKSVAASIEGNGWYGAIVVQQSTGTILAGHTRRRALVAMGRTSGPVLWVDCDNATAMRILLADNRTAELAEWDDATLLELLSESDDLAPVGFTQYDVEALMRKISPLDISPPVLDEPDIGPRMTTCPECGHSWAP